MKKIVLSMFLILSTVGVVRAQEATQETTGRVADAAKQEVLKIENEWVQALLKGPDAAIAYYEHYDAPNVAYTYAKGFLNRVEHLDYVRKGGASGGQKLVALRQDNLQIRIYANGLTAVSTSTNVDTHDVNGQNVPVYTLVTTVWVKQGGQWWRVAHTVFPDSSTHPTK